MPAPSTHYGRDVTGEARFRIGWFGRLILQVEVKDSRDNALGGDTFRWIDANDHDLYALRYQRKNKKMEPLI
jgi:hypothetical protein